MSIPELAKDRGFNMLVRAICLTWFSASAALNAGENHAAELREMRRSIREDQRDARRLEAAAHDALDRAHYEDAVRNHKQASVLRRKTETAKARYAELLRVAVKQLVPELSDESFEKREAATDRLLKLCLGHPEVLESYLKSADPETRSRVSRILPLAAAAKEDEHGRVRQWASRAQASSEYQSEGWSARQATGAPDTHHGGDAQTAWASQQADAGLEWLELSYDFPVYPAQVRIHENYAPGAVVKLEARDPKGAWTETWRGEAQAAVAPRWFEPEFKAPAWATREIRITLDSAAISGWNEIDAVELIGEPEW